jgi:hypothetical protein
MAHIEPLPRAYESADVEKSGFLNGKRQTVFMVIRHLENRDIPSLFRRRTSPVF